MPPRDGKPESLFCVHTLTTFQLLSRPIPSRDQRERLLHALHSLVIVSSRFKIALATVVHAASSLVSNFPSTFDSPTPTSFNAASRWLRYAADSVRSRSLSTCNSFASGSRAVASRNA